MRPKASQSGFSMVELMVAMVAAVIVAGAIFGLLSGGQGAFRREPEITDMQQNLRTAMDTISRDVTTAGGGLPGSIPFVQVFSQNLDNVDVARPNTSNTNSSDKTDEISMMISNSPCGAESVCGYQNGHASHIRTVGATTCVGENSVPIILNADGTWTIRYVEDVGRNNSSTGSCDPNEHSDIMVNSGRNDPTGLNQPGGLCQPNGFGTVTGAACNPVFILAADVISYRIALGPDGVPNLERGSTAALVSGTNQWQVIARGVEDLQVQYATAAAPTTFVSGAPQVLNNNYGSLITQVKITLNARTNQTNLQGQSRDRQGRDFVRSSLTSTVAVRTALLAVSRQFAMDPSPQPTPGWN